MMSLRSSSAPQTRRAPLVGRGWGWGSCNGTRARAETLGLVASIGLGRTLSRVIPKNAAIGGRPMTRYLAALALAAGLAACSVVDTMVDGFKHTRAVESALETSVGSKPAVGFNWHNGRLTQVTVT